MAPRQWYVALLTQDAAAADTPPAPRTRRRMSRGALEAPVLPVPQPAEAPRVRVERPALHDTHRSVLAVLVVFGQLVVLDAALARRPAYGWLRYLVWLLCLAQVALYVVSLTQLYIPPSRPWPGARRVAERVGGPLYVLLVVPLRT